MIAGPLIAIPCHICHRPVQLEKAVSDEKGKTVHSECYMCSIHTDLDEDDPHPSGLTEPRWLCQI